MNGFNHLSTDEMIHELHRRLMIAGVTNCTCMTKTPDPGYHSDTCRYARTARAADRLDQVKTLIEGILV
jgi:hypothetical protein